MKLRKRLKKTLSSLIAFIHLQLFITLVSLPILLAWGMPISMLTFAGNFLFSPILTLFLLLCSLIFFCEIAYVPNAPLIWILEYLTHAWLWLMQWATHRALIPFALPHPMILITIFLLALGILHHKKINTRARSIACFSILLLSSCFYLAIPGTNSQDLITYIECNKDRVAAIKQHNRTIVIDPGIIGRRLSASSWCEHSLMPALIKTFGSNTIDHFLILQPNRTIFETLANLQEKIAIKNIYIPYWNGAMPPAWLRSYMKLKRACSLHHCSLIRIGTKQLNLSSALSIHSLPTQIKIQKFSFPAFKITACIDKRDICLYSAKHKPVEKEDRDGSPKNIDGYCS